jgi:hypothetical protein
MRRFLAVLGVVGVLLLGWAAVARADTTTVVGDPGTGSGLPAAYCSVGISGYDLEGAPWLSVLCNTAIAIDLVNYPNGYIFADTTGDSLMHDYCTQSPVLIGGGAWTDHGGNWYSFGVEVSGFPTPDTYPCFAPPGPTQAWGVFPLSSGWAGSMLIGPSSGRSLHASVVFVGPIAVNALPTPPSVRFTATLAPNDDEPPTTTTTTEPATTTTEPATTTTEGEVTTTTACPEPPQCGDCTCQGAPEGWYASVSGDLDAVEADSGNTVRNVAVGFGIVVFLLGVWVVASWGR